MIKKSIDGVGIPLDIGATVKCRWRDGQMYPIRVIERRAGPGGKEAQEEYEYYVHYEQFNHRIYRAGQTEGTETVHVCAKGTLDERVYSVLSKKVNAMELLRNLMEAA